MTGEYNKELCVERHVKIDAFVLATTESIESVKSEVAERMKKLENRFLMIMTTLALNLTGVVILILMKGAK